MQKKKITYQILFASLERKNQYMYYIYTYFYRQKDVTTKIK